MGAVVARERGVPGGLSPLSISASKLQYRVRVCIEGIPAHAENVETSQLFQAPTFIETADMEKTTEDERACMCVWVWTTDPDSIAIEGLLSLEEPVEFTEEQHNDFFTRLGNMELPEVHNGPAGMLDYEIFLHVDRVVDYTPPTPSPSWKSYESETSGIPDDSVEEEWPVRHSFVWKLGVPDRQRTPPRRVSVQDRLGDRRRDRSPPGGSNGDGGHRMQIPSPSWRDIARPGGSRNVSGGQGSQGHGGTYRGRSSAREEVPVPSTTGAEEDAVNISGATEFCEAAASTKQNDPKKPVVQFADEEADDFYLSGERTDTEDVQRDPLFDAANETRCKGAAGRAQGPQQRADQVFSVEEEAAKSQQEIDILRPAGSRPDM